MDTSAYFENAIYQEQSPAATEYFDTKVPSIFVSDASQSWLEVFSSHMSQSVQSNHAFDRRDSKDRFSSNASINSEQVRRYQSDLDQESEKEISKSDGVETYDQGCHSGFYFARLEHEVHLDEFIQMGRDSMAVSYRHCVLILSRYLTGVSACCV